MKRNKKAVLTGAVLGAAAALPVVMIAPGRASKRKTAPFRGVNFAHRGLHTEDRTVPENSPEAFRRAAEAGYGIELDVRLTKDGKVVVLHDENLRRACGVDRRVDEITYDELRKLRLFGTSEHIPLLSEALEAVAGRGPLIVELKTGKRNRELCEKTCALLRAYGGPACVESFNPLIVAWFRFHAPEFFRGQLVSPLHEYRGENIPRFESTLLSAMLLNFAARPEFIARRIGPPTLPVRITKALGAMQLGWTSHDPASEQDYDSVIFEYYRPAVRYK